MYTKYNYIYTSMIVLYNYDRNIILLYKYDKDTLIQVFILNIITYIQV